MKKNPSVSVIIPTWNRFSLLCEAIESVLAQEDPDFELIVVDDGSTDETPDIQTLYEGRLFYIYQKNRGVSAARNRGISFARGKWIAFLDSDDLWKPEKLKIQKAAMLNHPEIRISYTEEIWYRKGIRVNPMKKHAKHSGWIFRHCLPLCIISPSSVMIRRSLFREVGTFDENLPVCEDYDMWLRITRKFPVHLIREPLIIKRNGHGKQLSACGWGFDRYRVRSLLKLLDSGTLTPLQARSARKILQQKCAILSRGFYKHGKIEEARYYEALSFQARGE